MNGKRMLLCMLLAAFLFTLMPHTPALADDAVPRSTIRYDGNGGASEAFGAYYDARVTGAHLRENTLLGTSYFRRDGYVLTGWNTAPDGGGTHIGLGSRVTYKEGMILYAEWAKAADESLFTFSDGTILLYSGTENTVIIPEAIGGEPVKTISSGVFENLSLRTVVLPPSLETVMNGAFSGCTIETLTLFDRIKTVSDASFLNCTIRTLRINAARQPVYSGSYYDTFSDKYDYLISLADDQKLVLFSGSSGRYGYDSPAIEAAIPDYRVVNMGVYAYTNALPQYELIRSQLHTGDILLVAPEFDAVEEQFCTTNRLDAGFWAMTESNYDVVSALDLTLYADVFDSFAVYQKTRDGMASKSYSESPFAYDDDGNRYSFATYNAQGDFILPRPNSERDELHRHNIADYTTETVTPEAVDALNRELHSIAADGITVLFTYAPRNRSSLTGRSTKAARNEIHRLLCERLSVPVISELEDLLYSGVYFWNIDNHLSTEGVRIRTKQIISDLSARLQTDGINVSAQPKPSFSLIKQGVPFLFGLAALLVLLGGLRPRVRFLGYVGGFVWAAGAVLALVSGASMSYVLLFTLGLLLVAAYGGKRGMA